MANKFIFIVIMHHYIKRQSIKLRRTGFNDSIIIFNCLLIEFKVSAYTRFKLETMTRYKSND